MIRGAVTIFVALLFLLVEPALAQSHSADTDTDYALSLQELLRVIQLYNAGEHHCDGSGEDGYAIGNTDRSCDAHSADYASPLWSLSLSELLRQIQLFSSQTFGCSESTEDGFDPGTSGGCVQALDVIINEFLTVNDTSVLDEDGDNEDWIELYNPNDFAVDLEGWSLTDSDDNPREWVFPAVSIPADGYLVVFASDKNRRPENGGELHTNFKLTSNGEYLALFTAEEPPRAATAFLPGFPPQEDDISYGRLPGLDEYGVLGTPTPGAANTLDELALPKADTPTAVPGRGFYETPQAVFLIAPVSGGQLRYTLDGSEPDETNGVDYSVPIAVSANAVIRAATFAEGSRRSDVITHSYKFGEAARIAPIAALSIAADEETALYEPDGIMAIVGGIYDGGHWTAVEPTDYNNALMNGQDYERRVSVEYLAPGGDNFQLDAGLRLHGSPVSRISRSRGDDWVSCECGPGQPAHCTNGQTSFNKFSFKLYFRNEYGQAWLEEPIIPNAAAPRLQHLVLRGGTGSCNRFLNDELVRRLHADMGHVAATGEVFALYLNGDFKGHYNGVQRLREPFFQEAQASSTGWDVIEEFEEVSEGDGIAWEAMRDFALGNDLSQQENYDALGAMLDIPHFVDYLLVQIYTGNVDWPFNNWTAARERSEGSRFRFYVWDAEAAFGNVNVNNFTTSVRGGGLNGEEFPVARIYRALRANAGFRALVQQRINLHLADGGALSSANLDVRRDELEAQMAGVFPDIDTSIIDTWMTQRAAIVLAQLEAEGLYTP